MNNKNIYDKIQILINHFNSKNFEEVISKSIILIKKNPNYVILYNLLGSAYQNRGDFKKAKESFKKGLQLEPNNFALMNNLGMANKNLLQYKSAEEIYSNIINLDNKYINAYINLGNLKRDLNEFNEAIELYEKALELSKKNPVIYYSLALANQGIGNFDKAIFYSEKVLEIDPNFTRADHLISQSTKYYYNHKHYLNLKKKINDNLKSNEKVDIYFSLAKAEEDMGNIKNATDYLVQGNKIKKRLIDYNVCEEINLFNDIKNKFDQSEIDTSEVCEKKEIIFILGMPRSGTSLVEQIISSHSDVFGGGELPILSNIIKNNFIKDNKSLKDDVLEIIEDPGLKRDLKSEYINFIKNFKFKEKYITDKAPLNFRWIGFIKILFPNAKIIHCSRDAKNNCLSMFKNLFEGGLNFTYDQEDLVKYYKSYLNLIKFWKLKYPNTIFDVKYENLISYNTEEIKKIIKFCDLKWDENCLSFHKNKTPIKTMSTAQARQPIYKTSLNAFDKFKDYLTILNNNL